MRFIATLLKGHSLPRVPGTRPGRDRKTPRNRLRKSLTHEDRTNDSRRHDQHTPSARAAQQARTNDSSEATRRARTAPDDAASRPLATRNVAPIWCNKGAQSAAAGTNDRSRRLGAHLVQQIGRRGSRGNNLSPPSDRGCAPDATKWPRRASAPPIALRQELDKAGSRAELAKPLHLMGRSLSGPAVTTACHRNRCSRWTGPS
jgi:hypothetical protein